ncbi:hypothetical protein B0A55_05858 [Friedmanniomyces simplex]|uniref:EXPERA domain-containing protein n=1 Tax=Friedmanniomyces simplex TaxID=329884 RepID=A0A4V5NFV2_9PEZI|nr:hypothetical protein B0A55_05858 [Friedmanniomyces simplex]
MADYLTSTANDMAKNASTLLQPLHPYYPLDASIANWAANEWSVPALLSVFFGTCTILFTSTYFVAKRVDKTLTSGELTTIMWFVLSGAIHLFFEGYYAAYYASLAAKQTLIGQMWKEYAFSDSRYLSNNAFVLCMETVTAVCWGPGCLAVAALIMRRHPLRYPIQMIVSMGQFYGDVLYYATSAFDHTVNGVTYSRPETFYYWFYFVLMNAFWIVIPGYLIYQSTVETAKAVYKAQEIDSRKKAS